MPYTLGQAAKAAGKAKASIAQAIADNRLSATKDAAGRWQIDPAELHRVYPPPKPKPNDSAHLPDTSHAAEIERLKATVEGLEKLCQQIEGERDRMHNQIVRLTALLPPPATAPKAGKWWQFGKRQSA
jgi:hypothetical protein